MQGVVEVNDKVEIPEGVLCTFGMKVNRGIQYFVGYRKGDIIRVHFGMTKHEIKNIFSYQPVLNLSGRKIYKK